MFTAFKRTLRRLRRKRKSQLFVGEIEKNKRFLSSSFKDDVKEPSNRTALSNKSLFSSLLAKDQVKEMQKKNPQKISFWKWFKIGFWVLFDLGLLLAIGGIGWIFYIADKAPELMPVDTFKLQESSAIYDSDGDNHLFTIIGNEDRRNISLVEVSENMQRAMVAAEDAEFWDHEGVSLFGILRSVVNAARAGRAVGGGSTLTQQVVKMMYFPDGEGTMQKKIERKIKEIILARKLEKKYGKQKILELYLNKSNFLGNVYGIEQAAQTIFQKSAQDLSIAESAVLAGLPQAPGRYTKYEYSVVLFSPEKLEKLNITSYDDLQNHRGSFKKGIFGKEVELANGHTDYINGRFDYVLKQMRTKVIKGRTITEEEYLTAIEESKTMKIKINRKGTLKAPHFVSYVLKELKFILSEKYGKNYEEIGGLKIYTTLDYKLQEKTKEILEKYAVENEKSYKIRNGAVLVMDPKTGEIKVMQGSRDYFSKEINGHSFDGEVNVLTSKRQPGSTFKPLSYAAAFEYKGLSPATVLMDVETKFASSTSKSYTPRNYDGKFHGPTSIRTALGHSYNIPAVKAGIIVGIKKVHELGTSMGVRFPEKWDHYGASFSLGSSEIQPLEMGMIYAAFANNGNKVSPVSISKIINNQGEIIYDIQEIQKDKEPEKVLEEETVFLITDILKDASARGSGWTKYMSLPGRESAAKTGTSTGYGVDGKIHPHDAWTIGYTPQLLTVVWTGNNKGWEGNKFGLLSDKASGLSNAAPIWRDVMTIAHEGLPVEKFPIPEGVRKIRVSKLSGKIPPENFPKKLTTLDYFNTSALPSSDDQTLKEIELVRGDKKLPNKYTPQRAIERFTYLSLHSYFPNNPVWEKPVEEWLKNNRKILSAKMGVSERFIDYIPIEVTDLYTETTSQNAPEIIITSPSDMGIVAAPFASVDVAIDAPRGISFVEYYWDDVLVTTKKKSPWRVNIDISGAKTGSKHTIKVLVVDKKSNERESSRVVKVGEDTQPPEISFVYPSSRALIEKGNLVQVSVDAFDKGSSVKSVEFFLDGNSVKTRKKSPFSFSWLADTQVGDHSFRAVAIDHKGNSAAAEVLFTIIKSSVALTPSIAPTPVILPLDPISSTLEAPRQTPDQAVTSNEKLVIKSPAEGTTVREGVLVSFFIPAEFRVSGANIQVSGKKKGGTKSVLYSITGNHIPPSGGASFFWKPDLSGEYDLSVKVSGSVGPSFSPKIGVRVK